MIKTKEDVIWLGQNVHTTQTFSKKETHKRPYLSLEGSITKLLTIKLSSFICLNIWLTLVFMARLHPSLFCDLAV
jgi:hypothetical protein